MDITWKLTILLAQGSLMLSTVLPLESSTTAIQISDGPIVLMADTAAAATFWQPVIASDREDGNYFRTGTNETVLVAGPDPPPLRSRPTSSR